MKTTQTTATTTTVDAYRVVATGQVVCPTCADDNLGPDGQMTGYLTYTRRKPGFYCVGCDAQA